MRIGFALFGLLIGIIAGVFIGNIQGEVILGFARDKMVFLILSLCLLLFLIFLAFVFQNQISKFVFGVGADSLVQFFDRLHALIKPEESDKRSTAEKIDQVARSAISIYAAWSFRIWIFRGIVTIVIATTGAFGTYILIEQNKIIQKQTDLLQRQEELVNLQTRSSQLDLLQQSSDRQNLFEPVVARIISELISGENINEELELADVANGEDEATENASEEITTSFSYLKDPAERELLTILSLLQPYTLVETEQQQLETTSPKSPTGIELAVKFLSPERGQILKAMMASGTGISFDEGDVAHFNYADMRDLDLDLYGNDPEADQCRNKDQDDLLYDMSSFTTDFADFSGSSIRAILLSLSNGEKLNDATLVLSRLSLLEGDTPPSISKLELIDSHLVVKSDAVDLSSLVFSHAKLGCIELRATSEEPMNFKALLNGLRIKLKTDRYADVSNWKDFMFGQYIKHNDLVSPNDYRVIEERVAGDEFHDLVITLQYSPQY